MDRLEELKKNMTESMISQLGIKEMKEAIEKLPGE